MSDVNKETNSPDSSGDASSSYILQAGGSITLPSGQVLQVVMDDSSERRARRLRRTLIGVFVGLMILLLIACAVLYALLRPDGLKFGRSNNTSIGWIRSVYGFGTEASQLMHPSSVAVAPDGRTFWVSDSAKFRLIEYNFNGTFKRLVTHYNGGKTRWQYPSAVAVAPNGTLVVAQQTYNNVLILDSSFTLIKKVAVQGPLSVAASSSMLVVGSRGGFAALKLDGSFIGQVGRFGRGKDAFDMVDGLALDNEDNLYVVDTQNNRVSKYDAAGDRIWMVKTGYPGNGGTKGGAGASKEQLEKKYPANLQIPQGVCLDANNRLIVVDMFDFSVAAFRTSDGTFIRKWGTYGRDDGSFSYPSAIAYNRQQDAFLGHDRLQRLDTQTLVRMYLDRAHRQGDALCGGPLTQHVGEKFLKLHGLHGPEQAAVLTVQGNGVGNDGVRVTLDDRGLQHAQGHTLPVQGTYKYG